MTNNLLKGMQFISKQTDKAIFEVMAEDSKIRDKWLITLNELLREWEENPQSKPRSSVSAAGMSV
jgi:hypothetical protein